MSGHPAYPNYAADPKDIQLQTGGYAYHGGSQAMVTQPSSTRSTTVVVTHPVSHVHQGPRMWTTEMCACFDDMQICCCALFCGWCAAIKLSQDMGEHGCVPCCVPGWLIALRTKLRTQQNIQGTIMDDCCKTTFCGECVLCQMMREVKHLQNSGVNLG